MVINSDQNTLPTRPYRKPHESSVNPHILLIEDIF
jgi:hypothetical protein